MKKALSVVSKACALLFTFVFGVLSVGTAIANNHVDTVSTALGQNIVNTVYVDGDEDDSDTDSDYYKSQYESVKEVRGAGIAYTQQIMEEGAVLLRNENNALPLSPNEKVSLFGVSSAKPTISGYRESNKSADVVSFKDGLTAAGLEVNTALFDFYLNSSYGRKSIFGHASFANAYTIGEAPWSALPAAKTAEGFKTAVFVVSRIAGEATDVQIRNLGESSKGFDARNGNYLILSNEERDVLANLKAEKAKGVFDKIIVVMNVTNQVACDFEDEFDIDALLYTGSIGTAGTKGIGRILAGQVNPGGRLSDTFWKNHYLNPVLANWGPESFNANNNTYNGFTYSNDSAASVVYQEGIYSGYRYTETRYEDTVLNTAGVGDFDYNEAVAYPFGYGLSYSEFSYSDSKAEYDEQTDKYNITVTITNEGQKAGKHAAQLFLQKPYTAYDRDKGIEKAAVELVDFAKTDLLEGGDSQTINMTVDKRDFACYDSYGEKTYILEAGDYYLTVAHDAHEAVNNILEAKAENGTRIDARKMVDERGANVRGDKTCAQKITLDSSGYKNYSKSVTGKEIVNRFDNADVKIYEAAGSGNKNAFNYVSRKNWSGTVKFGFDEGGNFLDNAVRLELTDAMKEDMIKTVEKGEGAMPVMGSTATNWQLIQLMNDEEGKPLDYDDPKWEELLDQLTWDDMVYLLSNGYSTTRAIESISKPKTYDQDSDLGVIMAYNADGHGLASRLADPDKDKYPPAYCDSGIVAATRNKELIYEYGVQWGEDCLWAGYTGLYGTGANIHRSPYLGRSYGYYSEDAVLMGKCIASLNLGMESKGAFMLLKHCVLNEQETGRIAGASWANEQTIREVYLRPFQIAVQEGEVQGVMTSLNRIGVIAAPHHDFLNEVLRGEFGMVGYCVTDSYMPHMNIASLLVAGNDLPLDQDNSLNRYKDYPNVAWAMRSAAHNILYSVVHSNAMNGATANTRYLRFQPEWQYYLGIFNPIALTLMIAGIAFLAVTETLYYLDKKKNGQKMFGSK